MLRGKPRRHSRFQIPEDRMAACLPCICTNDVIETSWAVALTRAFEQEMMVPLRVEVKPFERIVIGDTVLINSGSVPRS
jgi:hypothetical protein